MPDPRITVFTPTFNREYVLGRLYFSLKSQTSDSFVWHIVDDGSTDETEAAVRKWQHEGFIDILYSYQTNGGKQRAHNLAVEMCQTELFLCVDSDDYLVPYAIERFITTWDRVSRMRGIAGVVSLRGVDDRTPSGTQMPLGVLESSLDDLYRVYKFRGDTALLFLSNILKQFPFVLAPGETFIGESFVYQQIDQHYKLHVLNEILYVCEYLSDGYTANVRALIRANPNGYRILQRQAVTFAKTRRERFMRTVRYLVACRLSGYANPIRHAPNKLLAFLAYPVAQFAYIYFIRSS